MGPCLRRVRAARGQHLAGPEGVEAADGDDIARFGAGHLGEGRAVHAGEVAETLPAQMVALVQCAREHAAEILLALVLRMIGLEDLHRGPLAHLEAGGGARNIRRIVTERFQQAADTVVPLRRAEQHRHDMAIRERGLEIGIDFVPRRDCLLQQRLKQRVVEIRQRLHKFLARDLGVVAQRIRHLDEVGRRAFVVAVGAFADEIDITSDGLALDHRNLAHNQRLAGNRLQRLHGLCEALCGGVDLVDEDDVRNVAHIEKAQDRRQHDGARRVRLADHHCDIGDHGAVHRLLQEFDRAGAIQHRPVVAEIVEARRQDFRAHIPVARFGRGVADGIAVLRRALARHRPAACSMASIRLVLPLR